MAIIFAFLLIFWPQHCEEIDSSRHISTVKPADRVFIFDCDRYTGIGNNWIGEDGCMGTVLKLADGLVYVTPDPQTALEKLQLTGTSKQQRAGLNPFCTTRPDPKNQTVWGIAFPEQQLRLLKPKK